MTGDHLRENEYRDEKTGRILCKYCGHPTRKVLTLFNEEREICILCPCQKEKRDRQDAEMARQEFLNKVQKNRSMGMQEKALLQYTFRNDKYGKKQMAIAKNYVEQWEEMKKSSQGLIFWGAVGTGKTYLASCIANALLDQGVEVLMTNFTRILNDLSDFKERNARLDELGRCDLLILDDLGAERCSDFTMEQIFSVIDTRYRSRKPMILTTNLTLQELHHPDSQAKERIYDRILHRCTPVLVDGKNLRQIEAGENFSKANQLLTGNTL